MRSRTSARRRLSIGGLLAAWLAVVCGADARAVLQGSAGPARLEATPRHGTWVPLEVHRHLAFARLAVDGHPAVALVDSRSSCTVLSARLVRELGLAPQGDALLTGIGGDARSQRLPRIELTLGGWTMPDGAPMAMDLEPIARLVGRPFDAILGVGVFAHFAVDLDLPNARMGLSAADALDELAPPSDSVALRLVGATLQVQGRIEELEPAWLDVDLGSTANVSLYPAFVREHDLLAAREPRSTSWGGGVGGGRECDLAALDVLHLGPFELSDVPASFLRDVPASMTETGAAGNLGSGALGRFRCVFDLAHGRLFLAPGPDLDAPFERDRSGLTLQLSAGALEILHVAPGSAAARAGLRVGERIVAVDGAPVDARDDAQSTAWTRGPASKRVVLALADGREVALELAAYY